MKIYVYEQNGKQWADIALPPGAKAQRTIVVSDRAEALAAAKKEHGRVAAVLERVASDMPTLQVPDKVAKPGFWRRLKWLATGE